MGISGEAPLMLPQQQGNICIPDAGRSGNRPDPLTVCRASEVPCPSGGGGLNPVASTEPIVTDTPASCTDRSKPPKLYATPDPMTGKRRARVVIRTEDLDEATLALPLNVEVPAKAKALNYLMDETGTDRS